jgi:hypothetical protein
MVLAARRSPLMLLLLLLLFLLLLLLLLLLVLLLLLLASLALLAVSVCDEATMVLCHRGQQSFMLCLPMD